MSQSQSLRIVLCTKHDMVGALILNHLLPRLQGHCVKILLSNKVRDAECAIPELAQLKYLERDLPVGTVFPLVDALGGRHGQKLTFKALTARYQVPVTVVADVNDPQCRQDLADFAPDVILSVRFSSVFREPVISLPRLGTFNVHPGALPHYAGLFPSFRALLNNDPRIGASLHRVDASIDGGPLLGIAWTSTDPVKGLLWHVFKSYYGGLDLFLDLLPRLAAGDVPAGQAQDGTQRVYRSLPKSDQVADFVRHGLIWFDPVEYAQTLGLFLPDGITLDIP